MYSPAFSREWLWGAPKTRRKNDAMAALHLGRIVKGSTCGDPAFDQLSLDVLLGVSYGLWMLMFMYGYDVVYDGWWCLIDNHQKWAFHERKLGFDYRKVEI